LPHSVKWAARVAAPLEGEIVPRWTVEGAFYARRGYWQPFAKEHEAPTAEAAREWTVSEIGGCHHVKRHQVRIDRIAPAEP
jgi:ribosomal protein L20A (L18A)